MIDALVPVDLLRDAGTFGGVRQGDCLLGAPVLRGGRLAGLAPPRPGAERRMVLPTLAEAHVHLDKCHTIHRLGAVGGDLRAAIEAQHADKANWTVDDLLDRAERGLAEARAAGCAVLRSHVDWGEETDAPQSWQVLTAMDAPGVQWAALTGIDQHAEDGFSGRVAASVAKVPGAVLGAFVLDHDRAARDAGLARMIAAADRHGLALDFHVDEGLGDLDGVEAIADAVIAAGFQAPVLCGHAVALMDMPQADFARVADKLARAGIAVCALPTTNLYLQGRQEGTPDRRGLTRLRELRTAGVRIVIGSDNVGDAFCPTGQHDPMAALHLGLLAAHLDPPLDRWLPTITTDARAAMGLNPLFIDGAETAQLLASSAATTADLIAGRAPLRPFEEVFT